MKTFPLNNIEKIIFVTLFFYFSFIIFIIFKYPNLSKTSVTFFAIIFIGNIALLVKEKISISKNHEFYEIIVNRNQKIRLWTSLILVTISFLYYLSKFGIITADQVLLLNLGNCGAFLIIAISGNYTLNVKSNDLIGINSGVIKTELNENDYKLANNLIGKFQFWTGIIFIVLTFLLPQHLEIFEIPFSLFLLIIFLVIYPIVLLILNFLKLSLSK